MNRNLRSVGKERCLFEQDPEDLAWDRIGTVVGGDDHFAVAGEAEADDVVAGD